MWMELRLLIFGFEATNGLNAVSMTVDMEEIRREQTTGKKALPTF